MQLVLTVDRDDDLGTKTGIEAPVVGREANVDAATKLGVADPEDSDTNSILAAVNTYDDLNDQGKEVEVATITGSQDVGVASDTKLVDQLDELLADLDVDGVVFVTDGAEDEYIIPQIVSRVPVNSVKRVIVRQSADIEGTFYIFKRALEDEHLRRSLMVPVSLALIIYGVAALSGRPDLGLGAIALTLGFYVFVKGLNLEDILSRMGKALFRSLTQGKVSLFTSVFALLVAMGGAIEAYNASLAGVPTEPFIRSLAFVQHLLWWAVFATLIGAIGVVVDAYVRERRVLLSYWVLPFFLFAFGLIAEPALGLLKLYAQVGTIALTTELYVRVVVGLLLAMFGNISYRYLDEAEWFDQEPAEADRPRETEGPPGAG